MILSLIENNRVSFKEAGFFPFTVPLFYALKTKLHCPFIPAAMKLY